MSGLVLSRKKGERVIAGDVVVTLVEIRGDKARLLFEAPGDVAIHREEVYRRIQEGNGIVSEEPSNQAV